MMSFIGWKVWGLPGAVVSAFATIGPPYLMRGGDGRNVQYGDLLYQRPRAG
jgi:hypothetical protein